eukprot:6075140-Prorocentrum_lima.AAC.1
MEEEPRVHMENILAHTRTKHATNLRFLHGSMADRGAAVKGGSGHGDRGSAAVPGGLKLACIPLSCILAGRNGAVSYTHLRAHETR